MNFIRLLPRLEFMDPIGTLFFRYSLLYQALGYALMYATQKDKLPSLKKIEYKLAAKFTLKMALKDRIKPPDLILTLCNNLVLLLFGYLIVDEVVTVLKLVVR